MRSEESVPLQDFCRIVQGGRLGLSGNDFVPSGFPAYGAGGVNGYLATPEFDEPAIVLSAIGARCGKCFFTDGKWISLANTQLIFPDPARADCKFLWYQINDERRWHRSGTGQPFIKPSDVKAHRVFLPPLPDQRRMVEILDKADALRAKRRAALAQLDTLTQSIFLDMFGDPATNPKGLPTTRLGNVCTRITDGTHQPPAWSATGNPFLFVSNVINGEITFDTEKFISDETYAELTRRCPIEVGDVLYSTVGSYGVPAVVRTTRRFAFQRHIAHLKPDRSVFDSEFLRAMLASPPLKRQADRAARGVAQKTVNLSDIREFLVFRPPLPLQREFSRRVTAVAALKTVHCASAAKLDALFASLQHRAFRGEL